MKAEYDFSKAERGKFYDPKAVFNLPIYLEKDVDEFIRKLADEKGLEKGIYVGEAAVSQGIVLRLLDAFKTFNCYYA